MTTSTNGAAINLPVPQRRLQFTHDLWMDSLGLPIHSGYYIEDLRALELGRWEERGCDAAFVQLEGQQGITETRVSEVPARAVLLPVRLAFDEVVYVVQGRGATTIWRSGGERKSFEWQENSMFLLLRHGSVQSFGTSVGQIATMLSFACTPAPPPGQQPRGAHSRGASRRRPASPQIWSRTPSSSTTTIRIRSRRRLKPTLVTSPGSSSSRSPAT